MTTRSIADPLAESHMRMANELLDLLAENKELRAEIARRDAYQDVVTSVVNEAFAAEALEDEALEYDLPAFPVPFPNRFPIWDKWSDVPDGVKYLGIDQDPADFYPFVNHGGKRFFIANDGQFIAGADENMAAVAPFVEVK